MIFLTDIFSFDGYFSRMYIYFFRVSSGFRIESSGGGWLAVSYISSIQAIHSILHSVLLGNTM